MLSTRTAWTVVAAAAAVVLIAGTLVLAAASRPAAHDQAEQALRSIAGAQAEAKESQGRYGSYWLSGGDRTLEKLTHPIRTEGVADLRSIECPNGWLAAARIGDDVDVMSSRESRVVRAGSGEVVRPDCMTPEAVQSMLADLGVPRPTPAPAVSAFDRPEGASGFRPSYHITPGKNWMNDPQRPILVDGMWHYYYLYNAGYPKENGTEWYHLTSTDLVHWKDEGIAIAKYKNGLGDIETGSAVVDHDNSAGFGKDAVIAVMTQQDQGIQRQSLFYSTDNGYSFTAYAQNPVMENPGQPNWRDPKIIRDDAHGQWVMTLAEGNKIGMYTSPDLKDWHYASGVERNGLGTLECPELFQLDLDGDPSKRTWVLAASANGSGEGFTTGVAYWTGAWDGTRFTASEEHHQWLDAGSDFYAAVTWDDPRLTESQRMYSRHAIGWMNNWAYARQLPTEDWHGGADSIVRDIRLETIAGKPTLVSTPTAAMKSIEGPLATTGERRITPDGAGRLPAPEGGSYRLDLTLERTAEDDGSEARIELGSDGGTFATVGYDFANESAFISRDADAAATGNAELSPDYPATRRAVSPPRDGKVELTIFVDYCSVEVFINGGEKTMTSLVFPTAGPQSIKAVTAGGALTLKSFSYRQLAPTH
ncbi:glycoside hydrolase family 32 protein [Arthrobacter sp. ok909]|uniref:glycoside hydrolase family 32 protein n=1 Tax=Arthrobacter sp. ok909 TaxID=1761746 RepID=UPI0020C86482|nr:glycoside hydrolase family 32 protein [Arthrobacter sp. ok909]